MKFQYARLMRVLNTISIATGGVLVSACSSMGSDLSAAPETPFGTFSFERPIKLKAAGTEIKTEEPGYAAPAWHDVTGDGRPDLVVGQFKDGLMAFYEQNSDGTLADRQLMQADGIDASVPGIW